MDNDMTIPNQASLNGHHSALWLGRDCEVALAARTDACILLNGLPDAARKLAYRLHLSSGWRHGPFTVIDCAMTDPALEEIVFGTSHPSDASQRSDAPQLRLIQAGTVLLQEINRLPLSIQGRLARRLSDQHSAGPRSRRRLIASSSEPLFERVLNGTFDDSLYYRLNVVQFMVTGGEPRAVSASDW
jgi:DNA-binding NtrC family response regulator